MSPPYVNPGDLKLFDWFAGCALIGLVTSRPAVYLDEESDEDYSLTDEAFLIAREMLAARSEHVPRTEEEPPKGWAP